MIRSPDHVTVNPVPLKETGQSFVYSGGCRVPLRKLLMLFLSVLLVLLSVSACNGVPERPDQPRPASESLVPKPPVSAAEEAGTGDDPAAPGDADETATDEEVLKGFPAEGGAVSTEDPAASAAAPAVSPPATDPGLRVHLHVTGDFGREVLFAGAVEQHPGDTVLDVLERRLEVRTAYGGGFVNAISGLESGYTGRGRGGEQKDWLYWVNGVAAAVGPAQYRVRPGDHIWWDYQDWSTGQMANAVVGAFPQPFVGGHGSGSGGAMILSAAGYEREAESLASALRQYGAAPVRTAALDQELVQRRELPTLVVGPWKELETIAELAGWNARGPRSGIFLRLASDEVVVLDAAGRETRRYGAGTGAFWAGGNRPGDPAPVLVVTGTDRAGVAAVVALLTGAPDRCRGAFALVVNGAEVVSVP